MSVFPDPRLGTTIAGYRVDAVIGRGGMGVVYLAEHLRLQRRVALKLLAPELVDRPGFRERFIRESRLAASIDHPNILPIYDADEVGDVLYIAMRYVEGTDLKRLITERGRLEPPGAVRIVAQVASALDAAHARGLVHRDVKPGNVLIAVGSGSPEDGHVYLSDFGLTKRTSSDSGLTATGQFVGTLDYAAPEQFEGKALDARTDEYSLGCVLFECLTGEPPYVRDNDAAVMYAHLQAPTPKLSEQRPDLPPGIDAVVTTAMAKDPEQRYGTAGALAAAAAEALGVPTGVPATSSTTTGPVPAPPRRRRRRAGILLGAAAVVVAVAVLLVVLLNGGDGSSGATGPSATPALTDYVVRLDPTTGAVGRPLAVGKNPVGVVIAEGSAWVANGGDGTVSRIDPVTERVVAKIDVVQGPFAVAVGEDAVWVAGSETSLSRIDPATNDVVPFDVGIRPKSLAVGEGSVWVAHGLGQGSGPSEVEIGQFDARTGRHVRDIRVPGTIETPFGVGPDFPWAMAAGAGLLWTGGDNGDLYRIDSATGEILSKKALGKAISDISTAAESVWVGSNSTPGTVFAVDGQSGKVVDAIPAGGGRVGGPWNRPLHLAADEADVWVTEAINGAISRIVILSGQASPAVDVGEVPTGVALGLGSVWVTVDG